MKNFIKYNTLGNDFILLDFYKKQKNEISKILTRPDWKNFIIKSCNRHFGIGADGVLLLIPGPEILIFNADGDKAEICLNGLRCISDFLNQKHSLQNNFEIKMGGKIIESTVKKNCIINKINVISEIKKKTIYIKNQKITGHFLQIPNPHFIIKKKITTQYLLNYGTEIENHTEFENKTNVEFIYQVKKNSYNLLVHERGVGPTLACSSGATAVLFFLFKIKQITTNQKITFKMPGGKLICWIDKDKNINLQANAHNVFSGSFSQSFLNSCFKE